MSRDPNRRSASNSNCRGSSEDRRRRREWLVETYASDTLFFNLPLHDGAIEVFIHHKQQVEYLLEHGWVAQKTCRCYRCGELLTVNTVTVDRIIPGCKGGTYRRDNIRPSCESCMTITGSALGHEQKAAKKGAAKA